MASVRPLRALNSYGVFDAVRPRVQLGPYMVAVVTVTIATALRWPLRDVLGDAMPFFLFTPAVLIAAFNGGIKPGMFAVALSAVAGDFFFQVPFYALTIHSSKAMLSTFLFVLNSSMIAALGAGLYRAWCQAELHASETMGYLDRVSQSEQQSRRLAETAFEGIWSLDADGTATFVNARIAEMLGFPLSRMTSRPMLDFVFDEDRDAMQARLATRCSGGFDIFDFRFRRRDGSPLWCLVSVRSVLDRNDTYVGCLLMVTDISDRILERAAAEAERRRVRRRVGQLSSSLQEILSDLRHEASSSTTDSESLRMSIEQLSRIVEMSTQTAEQLACDHLRAPSCTHRAAARGPVATHVHGDPVDRAEVTAGPTPRSF